MIIKVKYDCSIVLRLKEAKDSNANVTLSDIYVQSCIVLFVPMFNVLHCIVSLVLYYVV